MENTTKHSSASLISTAADLWSAFAKEAGMDLVHYDSELMDDNETSTGLYQQLKLTKTESTFSTDLKNNNISVEALLNAIFKVIKPYGMMMSELCIFFEKYNIVQVDKEIRIKHNSFETDNLPFNLDHFREVVAEIEEFERFHIRYTDNINLFALMDLFSLNSLPDTPEDSVDEKILSDAQAKIWLTDFDNDRYEYINEPVTAIPQTGVKDLDKQLKICMEIWKSFVDECRLFGCSRMEAYNNMNEIDNNFNHFENNSVDKRWHINVLKRHLHDRWPGSFLRAIFICVDYINGLDKSKYEKNTNYLAQSLKDYLVDFPHIVTNEHRTVKKLSNFLNLPVWKKRHELYSVWMLTLFEKSLESHNITVHEQNGRLSMPFKPTKLISTKSIDGELNLYSEIRFSIKDLNSKKRVGSIQPDYTFLKNGETATDAFAVMEVKQYKKQNRHNFENAIKDYSKGCPNADIFLLTYCELSGLNIEQEYLTRNHPFGEVHPNSTNQTEFINKLKSIIPRPELPMLFPESQQSLLQQYSISEIFVDISASMRFFDEDEKQLNAILNALLSSFNSVSKMTAIDAMIRREWISPSIENIEELVNLDKGKSTDFIAFLPKKPSDGLVIITDISGSMDLENYKDSPYLMIVINDHQSSNVYIK